MGAGNGPQFRITVQPSEGDEFVHVVLVSAAGFAIGDIGEPFDFGRNLGEIAELRPRQTSCFYRNYM